MTRILIPLILMAFLLTACASASPTPYLLPEPIQKVGTPAVTAARQIEQPTQEPTQNLEIIKPTWQTTLPAVPIEADLSAEIQEISGRPTDTSITINVIPIRDMSISITYGSAGEIRQTEPVDARANLPCEITLSGLQPDTAYYYIVNDGVRHTFNTARNPGSSFTFDIQGDSHPERTKNQFNADLYIHTLSGAAADQPDFFIAIGDDFSVDTLKTINAQTVTERYAIQRPWLGLVDAPIFLVNGNHEQAALANLDGTAENVAVWAQNARNAYYPQPAPDTFYSGNTQPVEYIGLLRNYYAWEWGDALFVVIDPYWHSPQAVDNQFGAEKEGKKDRDLWNATLGEAQYRWFWETLENSTAKYKFVFAHHVNGTGRGGIELANSLEWGDAKNLAANRPGWDKTIHQIMVDTGVTIFFQGHDHIFVRQELDGVIYQSLPEPANPFNSWENEDAYLSGDEYPNSGRVRVTVGIDGVTVEYIRSYLDQPDELAFSYTLP